MRSIALLDLDMSPQERQLFIDVGILSLIIGDHTKSVIQAYAQQIGPQRAQIKELKDIEEESKLQGSWSKITQSKKTRTQIENQLAKVYCCCPRL